MSDSFTPDAAEDSFKADPPSVGSRALANIPGSLRNLAMNTPGVPTDAPARIAPGAASFYQSKGIPVQASPESEGIGDMVGHAVDKFNSFVEDPKGAIKEAFANDPAGTIALPAQIVSGLYRFFQTPTLRIATRAAKDLVTDPEALKKAATTIPGVNAAVNEVKGVMNNRAAVGKKWEDAVRRAVEEEAKSQPVGPPNHPPIWQTTEAPAAAASAEVPAQGPIPEPNLPSGRVPGKPAIATETGDVLQGIGNGEFVSRPMPGKPAPIDQPPVQPPTSPDAAPVQHPPFAPNAPFSPSRTARQLTPPPNIAEAEAQATQMAKDFHEEGLSPERAQEALNEMGATKEVAARTLFNLKRIKVLKGPMAQELKDLLSK